MSTDISIDFVIVPKLQEFLRYVLFFAMTDNDILV